MDTDPFTVLLKNMQRILEEARTVVADLETKVTAELANVGGLLIDIHNRVADLERRVSALEQGEERAIKERKQ